MPYGGRSSLKELGMCQTHVEAKDLHYVVKFYVVKRENLGSVMGFNTETKLSVIKVVNTIQEDKSRNVEDEEEFKLLFKGIGNCKIDRLIFTMTKMCSLLHNALERNRFIWETK